MLENGAHLVVGTPCYGGQVTSVYATSLLKLQHSCSRRGDVGFSALMPWGDALITRVRQDIVAHFLENAAATHLLFIDADIGFEPDQVFRLLEFGADVTAAVYPTKRIDWAKAAEAAKAGRAPLETAALSYVLEFEEPEKLAVRDGFAKVRYAGSGFLMIRRGALVAMIERYPELRYTRTQQPEDALRGSKWRSALFDCMIDEATSTYLSEDFSFCRRWTDMGGEIWADLKSRLSHTGPMTFFGDFAARLENLRS